MWDASTFSKNRDRLLDGSVAAAFLKAVLAIPRVKRLLSQDHFSVDGQNRQDLIARRHADHPHLIWDPLDQTGVLPS